MRNRTAMAWLLAAAACVWGCGDDEGSTTTGGGGMGGGAPADVQIEGLSAPVNAYFDDVGVLNASCQTDEDCAATLGYFHARDRFVQMDLRRRFSTGRLTQMLSEAARPIALPLDIENRALYSTRDGEPAEQAMLAQATPETLALFEAYAHGVNAWIEDLRAGRNGAQFPREFQNELVFDYDPERIPLWQPSDSVAAVMALINALTNNSSFEILLGRRRAELRAEFGDAQGELMFRDLFDTRPDIDSPVLPGFGGATASLWGGGHQCLPSGNPLLSPHHGAGLGSAAQVQGWFSEPLLGHPGRRGGYGSNNWIVGPSNSASGNALLSNDPHLGMTNPATWYVAHLDSKTNGSGELHAAGMTFAGLPFVIVGQNEHLAWGVTTTNFDMTDVYVEEVSADGNTVTFQGQQVPIIKQTATFTYSDGSTDEAELQFVPHHGPVLPRANPDDPMLTLRWTGSDASTDVNMLTDLARATNVNEARTVLEQVTTLGQNWVIADTEGNIGWFPYNRLPKRPWATWFEPANGAEAVPWLPLDGRGDFEWESYFDYSELPQALNPADGYLATANNDMTGALFDSDPTDASFGVFQTDVAPGYRHQRIVDLLAANSAHDSDSMLAIIGDTHSLIGEQLTPTILSAAMGLTLSEDAQKVITALNNWSFDCPTGLDGDDAESSPLSSDAAELLEASGCAAFHVAIREINKVALDDEGVPGERGPNVALVKMLKGETLGAGEIYWDDVDTMGVTETKDDIITAALDAAGSYLVANLGSDETQWAWGRIHILTLRSDVDTASGGIVTDFNESGFANDGGLFTVDVANPGGDYGQGAGPSVRFVCEALPAGPSCTIQLPGGQSGHVESPNYINLLPDFIGNNARPLQMDIAAAQASAVETVVLAAPSGT